MQYFQNSVTLEQCKKKRGRSSILLQKSETELYIRTLNELVACVYGRHKTYPQCKMSPA